MLYEKFEALEDINDRGPIFLRDDGIEVKYSFARLVSEARRVQSELQAHGFVKGDRIGIVIPDNQQFITTFLGAVMAGIIPVPMCPPFVVGQIKGYLYTIRKILDVSGARAVIASRATAPFLELSRKQVKSIEAVLLYDELESASTVNPKHVELVPDDTCFLQFTSGSTAMPKGVIVTHRNLMANARAMLVDALALDPKRDVGVNWLPLYHDMGLVGNVLAALLVEVPVVYIPTLSFIKNPQIWMAAVSRYRGTATFGPNFAYGLAAKRTTDAYVSKLDLSCLRVVGCGAEPINGEVLRRFQEVFAPAGLNPNAIMPCYGMAEATLAISFSSTLKPSLHERIERDAYEVEGVVRLASDPNLARSLEIVSCGTTFPGHEVAVFSHSGERLAEGRVGEIVFRGPSVTVGYYNNPEATGRTFKDGWLHTGDVGFMLNGEVFVSGRLKDLIIINGRNYYPQDIEWIVEKVNGIRRGNVVAFGVHENGMETIVVVAEIKGSTPVQRVQQEVKQITMSTLGITLTKVVLIPAGTLPKTTSGKIQRQKTKAAYERGILGQESWRYTQKVTFWFKYSITQILTRLPTRWRLIRISRRWLSGQRNSYQSTLRDIGASQH